MLQALWNCQTFPFMLPTSCLYHYTRASSVL